MNPVSRMIVLQSCNILIFIIVCRQYENNNTNNGGAKKVRSSGSFVEEGGKVHSVHENSEAHIEGVDRMERFLSIWEEIGELQPESAKLIYLRVSPLFVESDLPPKQASKSCHGAKPRGPRLEPTEQA